MRKFIFLLFVSIVCVVSVKGQLNSYLSTMSPERNYYDIKFSMIKYLDSLKKTMDSATFYAGDGEYKRFKIFESVWEPRVSPSGDFSDYYDAMEDYYQNREDDYSYYTTEPWYELGPKTLQTSGAKGIGPVEFITFYDNGTTDSTFIMLTGSTVGGLFYSTDTANTWHTTGTEEWDQSGCGWAVFHPHDYKTWYASSSGNLASTESLWIGPTGGVFRTNDEGQTWELIADKNDLETDYNIIYKMLISEQDSLVLYVASEKGLFRTRNCEAVPGSSVTWEKVLDGRIFDVELRPDNDSIMYAAVYDYDTKQWMIRMSENWGNQSTWYNIPAQPQVLPDSTIRHQHITIEVSKARPGFLYCLTRDSISHSLYYANMDAIFAWNEITTFSDGFGYGDGHGFGVEQTGNGDTVMVSNVFNSYKYNIFTGGEKPCTNVHSDVEDIVFHPYQNGEVWACTHGGVEQITGYGNAYTPHYNGLGVAQTEGFANAYTNAKYVLTGLYHDGTQLTVDDYQRDWETDWKHCVGGDGMKPLINNIHPDTMWGAAQWGIWKYSTDALQTHSDAGNTKPTYFLSSGILNKVNPNIFYHNKIYDGDGLDENVGRICKDFSLNDGKISDFKQFLPQLERTQITMLFTPYSNSDYLIANVISVDTVNNTTSHHLFRTTNVNEADTSRVRWHELTIPTNSHWIADVEFDKNNPDIIYVAYSTNWANPGIGMVFKIDYTDLQNPHTVPLTKNLPVTSTSAGCLATDNSDNGSLYLGTEYGIFYTNNYLLQQQGNEWQLFGTGFPHVHISGLEVNYPSHTLRAATFGRGTWELPLPCPVSDSAITITYDTAWNELMYIESDIVIEPGATLTVNYPGELQFPQGTKLIVKPGARLVLDSCLLTKKCYYRWQGIEVWGNDTLGQTAANQGKIEIRNGATIEYAEVAVRMGKSIVASPAGMGTPQDDLKGGGIIIAENANFVNNNTGVIFEPYAYNNTSRFLQCTFNYGNPVPAQETFYHARLYGVKYVRFAGCDFLNSSGINYSGYGIWSSNATFYVDRFCTALYGDDCTNWDVGNFTNLLYGVYSIASTTVPYTDVRNTNFNLNQTGIYLGGITLARITNNYFAVGRDPEVLVGLYMDACTDYWVEENLFNGKFILRNYGIGIVVNESGRANNEIYRNDFEYLDYSILAQGVNRDARTGDGLVCKCNTFTHNEYDIAVTDADQGETTDFGIAQNQGSSAAQADAPAGNRFSWTGPTGTDTDIDNLGLHFNYYFHDNEPQYLHLEPQYYDALKVNAVPNPLASWDSTSCISYIDTTGGGGSTEEEIRGMLFESQQASDSLSGMIQALEDAGDTEALEWTVDMSVPEQSYEVYNQLMNTAPYISDTVMGAAIQKEDVLPDAMIRDVMVASPESAKDDALLEQLNQRTNPPPAYMLAQILQGRSLVSVYGDLLAKQSYHNNRKAFAAKALERLYVNEPGNPAAQDSLTHLLQASENIRSQVQLAFLYMQQHDSASAASTLAAIPSNYPLDAQQLQEHAQLTAYLNQLMAMHGYLPDSTQAAWLMNTATEGNGMARTWARNLLLGLGQIEYNEPVILPLSTKSSPMDAYRNLDPSGPIPGQLEVYPNPASDHIIVKWALDTPPAGLTLKVTTIDGKLIREISLSGITGEKVIGTGHLIPGIYLVSIHNGPKIIESKKVSIN